MSFQRIANDDYLSFEDASLVYVRDKHGVLTSPPGYAKSKEISKLTESDTVYGAVCVRRLDSTLQSPVELFQICKNFVASNLHLLESLHNFPETVGHELFLEALKVKAFHKNSRYLKIFCEAYKQLVLEDLCLREATIMIDEYLSYFQCFNNLTKLDVSHCKLGNKHEYLVFIGKMKSLECLYLKDNCITDSGLASWSLPHRMLNTGPECLKILDLSCNPHLTGFCLKSLAKFIHLKALNLSGTGVTLTPGIERFKKIMKFDLVSYIKELSVEESITTTGWAASFISELSKLNNERNKKLTTLPKTNFYHRSVSSFLTKSSEKNTNIYPVVLLQSMDNVLPGTRRTVSQSGSEKRVLTSKGIKRHKNFKEHGKDEGFDELNDTNLLDSYLKYL